MRALHSPKCYRAFDAMRLCLLGMLDGPTCEKVRRMLSGSALRAALSQSRTRARALHAVHRHLLRSARHRATPVAGRPFLRTLRRRFAAASAVETNARRRRAAKAAPRRVQAPRCNQWRGQGIAARMLEAFSSELSSAAARVSGALGKVHNVKKCLRLEGEMPVGGATALRARRREVHEPSGALRVFAAADAAQQLMPRDSRCRALGLLAGT